MKRVYVLSCAVLSCALFAAALSPTASASDDIRSVLKDIFDGIGTGTPFLDVLSVWAGAITDPNTYMITSFDGFYAFLMNETFLSYLSSESVGSLTGSTMLGSIPNIFFILCILCIIVSVAVAIIDVKRAEKSRKAVKKKKSRS